MKETNGMTTGFLFSDDVFKKRRMKGILSYTVFKKGIPIESVKDENLILNGAGYSMVKLIAGDFAGHKVTKIGVGVNGTAPEATNEMLLGSFEKDLDGYTFPSMGQVQFDWSLTTNEANGKAILEFGLITEDGTLFARRTRENGKPINKENDVSIIGKWEIIF
jgi:hypothetical protein